MRVGRSFKAFIVVVSIALVLSVHATDVLARCRGCRRVRRGPVNCAPLKQVMIDDVYPSEVVSRGTIPSEPALVDRNLASEPGIEVGAADSIGARFYPDSDLTPGATFRGVTVAELAKPGYTSRVRNVPRSLKISVMNEYGLPVNTMSNYEIDHLVSLELGGSNDIKNLWPEPYAGTWNARVKDKLENRLHKMVVNGEIGLKEAQRAIATDWIKTYKRYYGDQP